MAGSLGLQAGDGKRLPKPNNIIPVEASLDTDFFKKWCIFLRPFVKLTEREVDIVSSLLKQRWQLSSIIADQAILDKTVMSPDIQKKVVEECNITQQHFYVVMSSLRSKGIIKNGLLEPRLIPNVRKDDNGVFQLLILFKDTEKSQR